MFLPANATTAAIGSAALSTSRQLAWSASQHIKRLDVNEPIPAPYITQSCVMLHHTLQRHCILPTILFALIFGGQATASLGDRLPEFGSCVSVSSSGTIAFYVKLTGSRTVWLLLVVAMAFIYVSAPSRVWNSQTDLFSAVEHRLLFWDCPSECDYTCQHIITDARISRDPPHLEPVVQFHGKWPFYRLFGMQEPFSVLFSLMNLLAHNWGLSQIRERIPASYSLRRYYILFGYCGLASWTFSMIFHTRDFKLTERLDYFAAGLSVMYGLYYSPIRIFRLDKRGGNETSTKRKESFVRLWTVFCGTAYLLHISYLSFWRFDYTYNMAANVTVGIIQNLLWTGFSIMRYRKVGRLWAAWPGLIVAWIVLAMSLELFDFAPWGRMLDAHALWHLGTVGPTIWWYR